MDLSPQLEVNFNRFISSYFPHGCPHCGERRFSEPKVVGMPTGDPIDNRVQGENPIFVIHIHCFTCASVYQFDYDTIVGVTR